MLTIFVFYLNCRGHVNLVLLLILVEVHNLATSFLFVPPAFLMPFSPIIQQFLSKFRTFYDSISSFLLTLSYNPLVILVVVSGLMVYIFEL